MNTNQPTQTRDEWLAARKTGISGTDVAAILGISPWTSALDVWLDKRGAAAPIIPSVAMRAGNTLESLVAEIYFEETGHVLTSPGFMRHPERDWMIGTPDRLAPDANLLLEIKTTRFASNEWGEPGTDQIPRYYLTQVEWYLELVNLDVADVALLVGGNEYRRYQVQRDRQLVDMLLEKCDEFWRKNVLGGEMPQVDGSKAATEYLVKRFPKNVSPLRAAAAEEIEVARRLAEIRKRLKGIESEESEAENILKLAIGESDGLDLGPLGSITWKAAKDSSKTDWKGVAAAMRAPADLIAQYTISTPGSRRFLPTFKEI